MPGENLSGSTVYLKSCIFRNNPTYHLRIQLKFRNCSRRNYYSELSFVIICVNEKAKRKKKQEKEYGRDGNGGTEIVMEKHLNYNEDVTTDTV